MRGWRSPRILRLERRVMKVHELLELRRDLADDQGFYGSRLAMGERSPR